MTTIPAVKAALVTLLTTALPSTQVVPGPVAVTTLRDRAFVVGAASTQGVLTGVSVDLSAYTEQYELTLIASAATAGTDYTPAETQAMADFAAAMAAIKANCTLGLTSVSVTLDGTFEVTYTDGPMGRTVEVSFPAAVFAAV